MAHDHQPIEPSSQAAAPKKAGGGHRPVALPGTNCWRREGTERLALLIDGAAYYAALRSSLIRAERSIVILAWELHTQVSLWRDGDPGDGYPVTLKDLLIALLNERPDLNVHILMWDFAVIYAMEREVVPSFSLPWNDHPRLHFVRDSAHPALGSQHHKLVLVDGKVAFTGGLDITANRWDTPDHAAEEPRRVNPNGTHYPPFHDVQLVCDADLAAALGDLASTRWLRATGEALPIASASGDPWPDAVTPDFTNIDVALARTDPAHAGRPEIREVERLYMDMIADARDCIFIENQYFTSKPVARALARRLEERDGPEVIIIMPAMTRHVIEETTMGLGRARVFRILHDADRHGRLRLLHPSTPGVEDTDFMVHSKLMIVDDRLLRIGNANLSNRSMGLDTEIDLLIEAEGKATLRATIAAARNRLLAEHMAATVDAVAEAIGQNGTVGAAIDRLNTNPRHLKRLEHEVSASIERLAPPTETIDPDRPLSTLVSPFIDDVTATDADRPASGSDAASTPDSPAVQPASIGLSRAAVLSLGIITLAAVVTILQRPGSLTLAGADALAADLASGIGLAGIVGLYILAGFVLFPMTAMLILTGLLFAPATAVLYGLAGLLTSAVVTFLAGRLVGPRRLGPVVGPSFDGIRARVAGQGTVAVAISRFVPIAPFGVFNMVAGASPIKLRSYIIGSLIGLLPGSVVLVLVGWLLRIAIAGPSPGHAIAALVLAVAAAGVSVAGHRLLKRWEAPFVGSDGNATESADDRPA